MKLCSKVSILGAVLIAATAFASADTILLGSYATIPGTNPGLFGNNATSFSPTTPAGISPVTGIGPVNTTQPGNGTTSTVALSNVTPTWAAAIGNSEWVSYDQTGPGTNLIHPPNGNYFFESSFSTVAGESYSGGIDIYADDTVAVFLNGHLENTPTNPGGFTHCSDGFPTCQGVATLVSFNPADFIIGGSNLLVFQVIQGNTQTMGLDYNGSVTGNVPEPSSLLLLGTGLVGAAGAMMRRMRRA